MIILAIGDILGSKGLGEIFQSRGVTCREIGYGRVRIPVASSCQKSGKVTECIRRQEVHKVGTILSIDISSIRGVEKDNVNEVRVLKG